MDKADMYRVLSRTQNKIDDLAEQAEDPYMEDELFLLSDKLEVHMEELLKGE